MVDFLLIYENKNRELYSLIALKSALLAKGYSVEILHCHFYHGLKKRAKVVLIPFAYNNTNLYDHVYRIVGKSQKLINLRWEQVYRIIDEENLSSFFYPQGQAQKLFTVCWGDCEKRYLEKCGVLANRILPVGNMTLDLLKSENSFKGKAVLGAKYGLNQNNNWILFISSFSSTSLSDAERKDLIERLGPERAEYIECSEKSKIQLLDWFSHLADSNKDLEFIYRAHPSEKNDPKVMAISNKYNNFHIINSESVDEWIYASDKIYNWLSSSAIQTVLLGKENILLRPVNIDSQNDYRMFINDKKITSLQELQANLREHSESYDISMYEDYYYQDGDAIKKMAAYCEKIYHLNKGCGIDYDKIIPKRSLLTIIKEFYFYYFIMPFLKFNYKHGINYSGKHKASFDAYKNVAKNIATKEEIQNIQNRINLIFRLR